MTPQKYLEELLASQDLSPRQVLDLESHKDEVTKFLQAQFGSAPKIKYAGSWVKGTMISDRYDLDIVCYFLHTDSRSLKEIREDVAKRLSAKYLTRQKSSAERILDLKGVAAPGDFHIDVVPGRFIEGSDDVFLHVQYGDKERMLTNLKTHIDHIVGSGCVPLIRLTKLWAHRNRVEIKTFVLELFVIDALTGSRNKGNLKEGFLEVLKAFRDDFATTQLIDPANTNNIVSQLMEPAEKSAIAQAADKTLDGIDGSDSLADWQAAFLETGTVTTKSSGGSGVASAAAGAVASGTSFTPTRQWGGSHDNGN
ncbi:MAG TPA: nucleotidyltransferase [Candidatus Paceibacterota bacterium]|jgi:hypothetical protein|nr:nucleotidyltransferase [Candidatus Paceibacterota bacterium]